MTAENPGESSSTLARRAWATQKFVRVAELDGVGVVICALAADDVHLETVFVDGGVLLALPHAKGGVHLFERRVWCGE